MVVQGNRIPEFAVRMRTLPVGVIFNLPGGPASHCVRNGASVVVEVPAWAERDSAYISAYIGVRKQCHKTPQKASVPRRTLRQEGVVAEECEMILFDHLWGLQLGLWQGWQPLKPKGNGIAVFHRFVNTKTTQRPAGEVVEKPPRSVDRGQRSAALGRRPGYARSSHPSGRAYVRRQQRAAAQSWRANRNP